jgi:hypothetical protein
MKTQYHNNNMVYSLMPADDARLGVMQLERMFDYFVAGNDQPQSVKRTSAETDQNVMQ